MNKFMDNDFLLLNKTAKYLYHNHASKMPINDYHSHVLVNEIFEDKTYDNITQAWLYSDHYKWRAMRLFGINEEYITGSKSDYDKFLAYAKMMPYLIGNPLYHWTHMELKNYFGIRKVLSEDTAEEIWKITKDKLSNGYSVRDMIEESNVLHICSTDDPIDNLQYHKDIKSQGYKVDVLPSFRPDKALEIKKDTFIPWIKKLGKVCNKEINDYQTLLDSLDERLNFFKQLGCKVADHGMEKILFANSTFKESDKIFNAKLNGEILTTKEEAKYKTHLTIHLAKRYYENDIVMQMHINASRNNNKKALIELGPDTGFDSILDAEIVPCLANLLSAINETGLPKTIIYSLNPKDNYSVATMMGNFAGGSYGTQVQFGAAWWFNDQMDGMKEHLKTYANLGILSKFLGMLTDSRSFLSYTRHEYFRRILCNTLGEWVEKGYYPEDLEILGKIVEDISYNNSIQFFHSNN